MKNLLSKKAAITLLIILSIISLNTSCWGSSEFRAKLIDVKTKKPVSKARVILAHKETGKPECIINTSLSAISNDNGEVHITNVPKGEYVIFYNISGKLSDKLKDKIVGYDPVLKPNLGGTSDQPGYLENIARTLGCPITLMAPANFEVVKGNLVFDGYLFAEQLDLGFISRNGELLKTTVPFTENNHLTIEINTEIGKKTQD
jgi:hypothetical protein